MRVLTLTSGRTGSRSFARAMSHQSIFSVAHDSRAGTVSKDRLVYPDWHIEVDTRFAWFLGSLAVLYGDAPVYVHLRRDNQEVIDSFFRRAAPVSSIMHGFAHGILGIEDRIHSEEWMDASALMVETVNANIALFLKSKSKTVEIDLENPQPGLVKLWGILGLDESNSDIEKAFEEYRLNLT